MANISRLKRYCAQCGHVSNFHARGSCEQDIWVAGTFYRCGCLAFEPLAAQLRLGGDPENYDYNSVRAAIMEKDTVTVTVTRDDGTVDHYEVWREPSPPPVSVSAAPKTEEPPTSGGPLAHVLETELPKFKDEGSEEAEVS